MVSFDLCQGNPGAMTFMLEAYGLDKNGELRDPFKAESAFSRMEEAGIKGSNLYCLWADCCGKDTDKAIDIMISKPIEEILDHLPGPKNGAYGRPFEEAVA